MPDVSTRAVARNIFRWAPLIARRGQRDSAAGPCDQTINSAPSRRAVWRHTLRSFKALVGTSYAGPKPSPDGETDPK